MFPVKILLQKKRLYSHLIKSKKETMKTLLVILFSAAKLQKIIRGMLKECKVKKLLTNE